MQSYPGNIIMVVAPSGAGKSSLVNALLAQDPELCLSVSCTTRPPRAGEIDQRDYRFVSVAEFEALRDQGDMLEWAQVHGNLYGTPRDRVQQTIAAGGDIILEIDWQGARQVRRHYPQAIGVFLLPPSLQVLESRLRTRGLDTPDVVARRLQAAGGEMAHATDCEYVIINQEFSLALQQLSYVVMAARLRYAAQAQRHAAVFAKLGISHPISTDP